MPNLFFSVNQGSFIIVILLLVIRKLISCFKILGIVNFLITLSIATEKIVIRT